MATHTFGAIEIAGIGGGGPVPCRTRKTVVGRSVVHQVIVMPNDTAEIKRNALCGARSKSGWLLNPPAGDSSCVRCSRHLADAGRTS